MSAGHDERLARVALSRLAEPGDAKFRGLIAEIGATQVHEFLASERDLTGVRTEIAGRLDTLDPAGDLDRAARMGIRYLIPGDDEWPTQIDGLEGCVDTRRSGGPPLGLWVKGPLRLDEIDDALAIVGSRSATTYGTDVAGEIAAHVAETGTCIVSGAAFGIDQAAHRGALAVGGRTVAVLAGGVDKAYPDAHAALLRHIGQHGAVVSEMPPGSAPMRHRFLLRNRLIAGLSKGTLVVEAAVRSGALSTSTWTTKLNRSVLAVPGPVTMAQSEGAHQLIRSGAATLVTKGAEVLELIKPFGEHLVTEPRGPERARDRLDPRVARVLEAVPVATPVGLESIARTAGLSSDEVDEALQLLGTEGMVVRQHNGWVLGEAARV